MPEVFYTAEQKNILKEESKKDTSMRNSMSQSTGLMILDALGEQQNTLQNIESILQRIEKLILLEQQNR